MLFIRIIGMNKPFLFFTMFNPEIFEQSVIGMVIYTQKIWDFILSADLQQVTHSLKQIFLLTQ